MKTIQIRNQTGVALVFALLLLIVMTIIGLSAMSGSSMQERMAGNVNLQSVAFEASSAGISQALDFGVRERNEQGGCERGGDNVPWFGDFNDFDPVQLTPMSSAVHDLTIEYRLRADCREDEDALEDADGNVPVQWFVVSEGSVWSGAERLAIREIEVRLDDFRSDGLAGLRIEGEADITFNAANSDSFTMDGRGGPAISAKTADNAGHISDQIGSDRLVNYTGGVGVSPYPPPFNDSAEMAHFAKRIKGWMRWENRPSNECGGQPLNHYSGDLSLAGNQSVNGITYVEGDASFGGNASGSGLLIVEGNLASNGTPDFEGLIIVLGGGDSTHHLDLSGGGDGVTNGMIYVANIDMEYFNPDFNSFDFNNPYWETVIDPFFRGLEDDIADLTYEDLYTISPDDGFEGTSIRFGGGGNHSINYDCNLIDAQRVALMACGLDEPWEDAGCNIPGQGGSIQAIRSWREDFSGRSG